MAQINFPAAPAIGQVYKFGDYTYTYDGVKWTSVATYSGAATKVVSAEPPKYQEEGIQWFDTDSGRSYVWTEGVWVEDSPQSVVTSADQNGDHESSVEVQALTEGQTQVTFNNLDANTCKVSVIGQNVDSADLLKGDDYTVVNDRTINLARTYPEGTVIKGSYSSAEGSSSAEYSSPFNRRIVKLEEGERYANYSDDGRELTPRLHANDKQYVPVANIGAGFTFTSGIPTDNSDGTITVQTSAGIKVFSSIDAEATTRKEQRTDSASQLGLAYLADWAAGLVIPDGAMTAKLAVWHDGQFYSVGTDTGFTSNDFGVDLGRGWFVSAELTTQMQQWRDAGDVRGWGAKLDGITNDYAAVQRAVKDIYSRANKTAGKFSKFTNYELIFNGGTCKINGTVLTLGSITFVSGGCLIVSDNDNNTPVFDSAKVVEGEWVSNDGDNLNAVLGAHISNLKFKGLVFQSVRYAIRMNGCFWGTSLKECTFYDVGRAVKANQCFYATYEDIDIKGRIKDEYFADIGVMEFGSNTNLCRFINVNCGALYTTPSADARGIGLDFKEGLTACVIKNSEFGI